MGGASLITNLKCPLTGDTGDRHCSVSSNSAVLVSLLPAGSTYRLGNCSTRIIASCSLQDCWSVSESPGPGGSPSADETPARRKSASISSRFAVPRIESTPATFIARPRGRLEWATAASHGCSGLPAEKASQLDLARQLDLRQLREVTPGRQSPSLAPEHRQKRPVTGLSSRPHTFCSYA